MNVEELHSILLEGSVYIYPLVFALLLLAGLCFPISADLVLLACSYLVYQNMAHWEFLYVAAAGGILSGDSIMHFLGRKLGNRSRWPNFLSSRLPQHRCEALSGQFRSLGVGIVFLARFMPGVRTVVMFFSGVSRVHFGKFLFADFLGVSVVVPALLLSAEYFKQTQTTWDQLATRLAVLAAAALIVLIFLQFKYTKNKLRALKRFFR